MPITLEGLKKKMVKRLKKADKNEKSQALWECLYEPLIFKLYGLKSKMEGKVGGPGPDNFEKIYKELCDWVPSKINKDKEPLEPAFAEGLINIWKEMKTFVSGVIKETGIISSMTPEEIVKAAFCVKCLPLRTEWLGPNVVAEIGEKWVLVLTGRMKETGKPHFFVYPEKAQ